MEDHAEGRDSSDMKNPSFLQVHMMPILKWWLKYAKEEIMYFWSQCKSMVVRCFTRKSLYGPIMSNYDEMGGKE